MQIYLSSLYSLQQRFAAKSVISNPTAVEFPKATAKEKILKKLKVANSIPIEEFKLLAEELKVPKDAVDNVLKELIKEKFIVPSYKRYAIESVMLIRSPNSTYDENDPITQACLRKNGYLMFPEKDLYLPNAYDQALVKLLQFIETVQNKKNILRKHPVYDYGKLQIDSDGKMPDRYSLVQELNCTLNIISEQLRNLKANKFNLLTELRNNAGYYIKAGRSAKGSLDNATKVLQQKLKEKALFSLHLALEDFFNPKNP